MTHRTAASRTTTASRTAGTRPAARARRIPALALVAALAATVGATLLLSGCGMSLNPVGRANVSWNDYDTAKKSDDGYRVPMLVPDDATDIRLRYDLQTTGAWFRFDSETGPTADYCAAGSMRGDGGSDASWWPDEVPDDGLVCGNWHVFHDDGHWYAWDAR
ncbi:hypothetical protein [Schumannella sp. 10F1B-5-1]|uniref:hypothetical protein n=1 Tax=Schumannella sp. 10F1B-5-1 TaxID=2590780 RepID=UPI001130B38E|nr:hypothetical protein [Schumannella sp. 10F1B-5-1]TPW71509.1 hypothetical protein FJ658_09040 [Schumannella sp. 10F1B-5-1]